MFPAAIRRTLPLCLLATLATAPLVAQAVKPAAAAPAPVAYVYVATSKGINLYNAASNGKLTLVSGSPYNKTTGLMIGSNQKYFITLGTDWVHAYPVAANGAIGAQVSQINTQSYSGYACGTTNGAVLDHSGQYLYVLLNVPPDNDPVCDAFQTFKIANNGLLTFAGSTTTDTGAPPMRNLPTIMSNEKFAYAINDFNEPAEGIYLNDWSGFARKSDGTLSYQSFFVDNPIPKIDEGGDGDYRWIPTFVTADPNNHLAASLHTWYHPPYGTPDGTPRLASYTVDSSGNISSSNGYTNMPTADVFPNVMNMSPDGKLLALGGDGGFQVFHFNGAAPITRYSKLLTTDTINWIHWDKANHLYALSTNGKLYVYTITPTSIAAAPGSPYTTSGPASGLFVVPK